MKRGMSRIIFIFFVIVSLIFALFLITFGKALTGESVTGEATTGKVLAQSTNVSIFVLSTGTPNLTIISPENRTYAFDTYLLLNYTASNANTIWYNLDLGSNITITSSIYFNTSQGSHTLYLYANNTQGTTSKNVSFFVNLSYGWLMNTTKYYGNTTNFTYWMDMGKSYMQNITNFTLEIPNYGRIVFNVPINISHDLYLDDYSDIANNTIYINSNQLSEFNVSATLWLYNLTLSNPRILIDSQICPSSICTKQSYSSGILIFNVTHFTTYSTEETPTESPSPGGVSGGGGGGGGVSSITKFSIDKDKIKVSLKKGETKKELLTITNTGNTKISISLSSPELEGFIKISEMSFDLNAGETKVIILDIIAREDAIPDLNVGKIKVKSDKIEKEILIAIEIGSSKPLFDVEVEIPKKFLTVSPGEEILATINLFNIMGKGKVDVRVEYIIKNEENKVIVFEEETVAVETQTSFIKEFKIPSDVKYGKYMFYIKTTYNGNVASASAWFDVGRKSFLTIENRLLIIFIFIVIFILIVFYELRKIRKHIKAHMKIDEETLVREGLIKLKRTKSSRRIELLREMPSSEEPHIETY